MIHNVSDAIKNSGADQKKIHFELFSSDQASSKLKKEKKGSSSKQNLSSVTVVLDGEKTHFEQKPNDFVLDAALAAGADIPYACKGAVCCTCRAKVLEGDIEMSMNYSLTEEEVEEGYVLSCQSMPRSSNVVMSFDD
jgi:ring-1,2-phenylacetyl-CoA epoxidase subunit PaaE